MPNVVVTTGILCGGIGTVLRLQGTIERRLVESMRPGVSSNIRQTLPHPLRQSSLQSVVLRFIAVRQKIDELEIGEGGCEGTMRVVLAVPASEFRCRLVWDLVNVIHAIQLCSLTSHITYLQIG